MSKTALLFAGQGAQYVGMGKDLGDRFPAARALFDEANAALDCDLASLCFSGPEADLNRTENAQPGIYVVSWVAFRLLCEAVPDLRFEATAGLSLGEFTALAAAGAWSFQDGLRMVRARGRMMQDACDQTCGGMAAIIGLEEAATRAICAEVDVELANLNCPGQLIISGELDRINQACELAKARGAKRAMLLRGVGAYHSRLMLGAQAGLREELAGATVSTPSVPVLSNVTALPHGEPGQIRESMVEQLTGSVLWERSIQYLLERGFTRFIELGPGKALTGFMKRIDKTAEVFNVADVPSLEATAKALTEKGD